MVLPAGPVVVAQWHVTGGIAPVGLSLVDAPRLTVLADGRAIASAERVLTLPESEVVTLVGQLRASLAGLEPTAVPDTRSQVADAPTSTLAVLTAAGQLQSVQAEALGIIDGFPARLVAADAALGELARRVMEDGEPYVADRVRLVIEPHDPSPDWAKPWPATVAVPTILGQSPSGRIPFGGRVAHLIGEAAATVVRELAEAANDDGPWEVRRLPDGSLVYVAWRYLLPHEP